MVSSSGAVGKSSTVVSWKESSLPGIDFGGNSYGAVLAREVLLFHGVGGYLVYWGVLNTDHWFSQGCLHQNC